jgi:hypothetical protein
VIKLNISLIYNLLIILFENLNKNMSYLGLGLKSNLLVYFLKESDKFYLDQES